MEILFKDGVADAPRPQPDKQAPRQVERPRDQLAPCAVELQAKFDF